MQVDRQEKTMDENALKNDLLLGLVPKIAERLGRNGLRRGEINALGFVVDKKFDPKYSPELFISNVFMLEPEDVQHESVWKIYNVIYKLEVEELNGIIAKATTSEEKTRLESMKTFWEAVYKAGARAYQSGQNISIGTVPPDWIPEWMSRV